MRSGPMVCALSAALAMPLAVPHAAHAELPRLESDRPQEDPYEQPMFVAGAITFLTSYGLSFGFTAGSLDSDNKGLYAPVVGPWLALAASDDTGDDVVLVADGVAQAAGVALMVASLIRSDRARSRDVRLAITSKTVGVAARF